MGIVRVGLTPSDNANYTSDPANERNPPGVKRICSSTPPGGIH